MDHLGRMYFSMYSQCPVLSTAGLNGQADPIPANDPIQVAMEAPAQAPKRRITFEELVSEDDIDVPDFMK